MRFGRGPREVYRVYGEDDMPSVDEWSGVQAPTRELDVERPPPDAPTHGIETEPAAPPSDEPRYTRQPHARLGQARRVAVMTLLGLGVGLVAALALHSLRAPAGGDGRRAGWAGPGRSGWAGPGRSQSSGQGAASWPSTSPSVPVVAVPAGAHTPRTVRAAPVPVAALRAPRGHSKAQRESGVQRESARNRPHGESTTRQAVSAAYAAAHPAVYAAAAPPQGTAEAQAPAEAASEFTFER
jgi:hypothetical protein